LPQGESDPGLGGLEPGCGYVVGMRLDGGRHEIEAALLTESRIASNDGFTDPEPWYLIGDDFLSVRQRTRKLSALSNKQGAEVFGSCGYVGIVIMYHGWNKVVPTFQPHRRGEPALGGLPGSPRFRASYSYSIASSFISS
jgi:hypothetical protein